MAYKPLSLEKYTETANMIARLKEFKNPLTFSDRISLAKLEEANEAYKVAVDDKNAALLVADVKTIAVNAAADNVDWVRTKLRTSEGIASDNESDIFVVLGGTRQSEINAKAQQTLAEKKKAAAEKDKDAPK